jgi:hypothetical protein
MGLRCQPVDASPKVPKKAFFAFGRLRVFFPFIFVFRVLPIRFGCTGAITSRRLKKQTRRIDVNEVFMGATIGLAVGITLAVSDLFAAVNNIAIVADDLQ